MEFAKIGVKVVDEDAFARLSHLVVGSRLPAWIKVTRLEGPKCTKIRQLLRHKGFTLKMIGCSSMSVCQRVQD